MLPSPVAGRALDVCNKFAPFNREGYVTRYPGQISGNVYTFREQWSILFNAMKQ